MLLAQSLCHREMLLSCPVVLSNFVVFSGALRRFAASEDSTVARAALLAGEYGITLPEEE